jgi:hypothetical protein
MSLNPFFLNGTQSEQRLVQQLINEQLRMYGIDVTYIPRKYVRKDTILNEVQSSKFDDFYTIEAYVNTYEGYSGQGDILTKFGMSLRDELTITISRERFEEFIAPFLATDEDKEMSSILRPREGDLVYFPLGDRLFEVKFVEHEEPFYQLGKNYVYVLKCELFEYEDELIDTSISEIDTNIRESEYIASLKLIGVGHTAIVIPSIGTGYIRKIYLNNDGHGYTSPPTITISSPIGYGVTATAVAITTTVNNVTSIKEILLTNAGSGYTSVPSIFITGGGGTGAAATCSIETSQNGVVSFIIDDPGSGYSSPPLLSFSGGISGVGSTASAVSQVSLVQSTPAGFLGKQVTFVGLRDPGVGYNEIPVITVSAPSIVTGIGTFLFNEEVVGSTSGARARVKSWDANNKTIKLSISDGEFIEGEIIIGTASSARYSVYQYDDKNSYDKYSQNDEIEEEADLVLDFSQSNPFGNY